MPHVKEKPIHYIGKVVRQKAGFVGFCNGVSEWDSENHCYFLMVYTGCATGGDSLWIEDDIDGILSDEHYNEMQKYFAYPLEDMVHE